MRILVPLDTPKEVSKLSELGADEFFCGVIDDEWRNKYSDFTSPNHITNASANLDSFLQLRDTVKLAHSFNKKVRFCLNSSYRPGIEAYAKRALELGVDSVIVGDLPTLYELWRRGYKQQIVAGTVLNIMNSEAIKLIKSFGVKIAILPRHLSIDEIKNIATDNKGMEFEIIIRNNGCSNCDGICSFSHTRGKYLLQKIDKIITKTMGGSKNVISLIFKNKVRRVNEKLYKVYALVFGHLVFGCGLKFDITQLNEFYQDDRTSIAKQLECVLQSSYDLSKDACGACFLTDFINLSNITGVKIAGRGLSLAKKANDLRFIKEAIKIASGSDKEALPCRIAIMELYNKIYGYSCNKYCYYASSK